MPFKKSFVQRSNFNQKTNTISLLFFIHKGNATHHRYSIFNTSDGFFFAELF